MTRTWVGRILMGLLAASVVVVSPVRAGAEIRAGEDVFNFGTAGYFGSTGSLALSQPLVGMASTPSGSGYWLLGRDGGVFGYGDAAFHGSTGNLRLNQPVVGLGADPLNRGYWFVASDGGIFAFDVPFLGSMGGTPLNQPVVGMAPSKSGNGYWLVARDGGIFAFGDAPFSGSTGNLVLNQPIVAMAADPDGTGYWFVAADGGVFAFDAEFAGSGAGRLALGDRVVGMAANQSGKGYWLATAKGAVLAFGGAESFGDATTAFRPISALAAHPSGKGYWLVAARNLPTPPAPPRLSGTSDTIRTTSGSSCWKTDAAATALCADTFGFPGSTSILNVRRGETVTVRFDSGADPLNARVFLFDASGEGTVRELAGSTPMTFKADFPPGLYRMGMSTGWVQGDASFFFRLNVR